MPKLTENFVTKLKALAAGYAIHWDDKVKGFGVRITAAGAIAFIFNYRTRAGRQRRLKIGSPPTYTVEAARMVAKRHRHAVDQGSDPLADWHGERDAPTFAVSPTTTLRSTCQRSARRRPTSKPSTTCFWTSSGRARSPRSPSLTSTAFTTRSPKRVPSTDSLTISQRQTPAQMEEGPDRAQAHRPSPV